MESNNNLIALEAQGHFNNQMPQMFYFEGNEFRTILINGEPWFVAKDVCEILEIGNSSDVIKRLDADEVDSIEVIDSLGRWQSTNIVNEYGLYSLILGSRKPEAKEFKRWITHEVIPSIRKKGTYSMLPQTYSDALRQLADTWEQKERLLLENKINQPKVIGYEKMIDADNNQNWNQVAKVLGWGRNTLLKELRKKEILMSNKGYKNIPYQRYINAEYFVVKESTMELTNNETGKTFTKNVTQTYVTPKGLDFLNRLLNLTN